MACEKAHRAAAAILIANRRETVYNTNIGNENTNLKETRTMTTTSPEIIEENTPSVEENEVSGYNDFDYTVTNSDGSYHGGL